MYDAPAITVSYRQLKNLVNTEIEFSDVAVC